MGTESEAPTAPGSRIPPLPQRPGLFEPKTVREPDGDSSNLFDDDRSILSDSQPSDQPGSQASATTRKAQLSRSTFQGSSAKSRKNKIHRWLRLTHVYIGMFAMFFLLFFATTGLLLNNPSWTLGTSTSVNTMEGTLPEGVITDGSIDYLAADQFFRTNLGLHGDVADYGETSNEASITYKNPGYSAYAYFDTTTSAYTVTVTSAGLVSTINDLHTSNNAGGFWSFIIDVVAVLLILMALTGIGIQLFLRKRRRSSLVTAAIGLATLIGLGLWVVLT